MSKWGVGGRPILKYIYRRVMILKLRGGGVNKSVDMKSQVFNSFPTKINYFFSLEK